MTESRASIESKLQRQQFTLSLPFTSGTPAEASATAGTSACTDPFTAPAPVVHPARLIFSRCQIRLLKHPPPRVSYPQGRSSLLVRGETRHCQTVACRQPRRTRHLHIVQLSISSQSCQILCGLPSRIKKSVSCCGGRCRDRLQLAVEPSAFGTHRAGGRFRWGRVGPCALSCRPRRRSPAQSSDALMPAAFINCL